VITLIVLWKRYSHTNNVSIPALLKFYPSEIFLSEMVSQ
jgi:hypothetical protein